MTPVRIATGSRLHFGLLAVPPRPDWTPDGRRYYGGVGLMIDRPGVALRVEPARDWSARGQLSERALTAARRVAAVVGRAATVTVESCPPPHVGLGVGTQLELAAALATCAALGVDRPLDELARLTTRGRRSAIGVHGFALGGLIVDGGKRRPDDLGELVARRDFPAAWRIVVLTPAAEPAWHGRREDAAFECGRIAADDRLAPLIWNDLLPALDRADFPAASAAIAEYNARVGDCFAPVQGGRFSHPAVAEIVAWLHSEGIAGAGQSSWGPTTFAWVEDEDRAQSLLRQAQHRWGDRLCAVVTGARNHGADVVH